MHTHRCWRSECVNDHCRLNDCSDRLLANRREVVDNRAVVVLRHVSGQKGALAEIRIQLQTKACFTSDKRSGRVCLTCPVVYETTLGFAYVDGESLSGLEAEISGYIYRSHLAHDAGILAHAGDEAVRVLQQLGAGGVVAAGGVHGGQSGREGLLSHLGLIAVKQLTIGRAALSGTAAER